MANRKLYALLVGINRYLGTVRPLRGCVNDVNNVESMLNDLYGNQFDSLIIKKLLDHEATRENIINAFQSHLIAQATENDVIYFHFSGHGSQEKAPKEFFDFDAKDKNETLVCVDSRLPGKYDLADKEIGVLLHLASQKTKHIIMVADSCHSGTINRGDEIGAFEARFEEENPTGRGYETYLNGYLKQNKILKVPPFEGVVFSACADEERAQEDSKNQCGLYTNNFVKALRENHGDISYAELITSVRSKVESLVSTQHPQSDLGANTSAHSLFLSDKMNPTHRVGGHAIYQLNGSWRIAAGAAHGLPQDGSEFPVEIYGKENKPIGKGKITGISIASSSLEVTEGNLETSKIYRGMLLNAPVMPLKVYVKDDNVRKILEDSMKEREDETRYFVKLEKMDLPLEFMLEYSETGMFQLKYKKTGILIVETPESENILESLGKLERKTRLARLKNPNTSLNANDFGLELAVTNVNGEIETHTSPEIRLDLLQIDGQWRKIPLQIKLENKSDEELHFMLFHLSSKYEIKSYFDLKLPASSGKKNVFAKAVSFNIPEASLNESTDEFLLVISDEKLDKMDFEQTAIDKFSGSTRDLEIEEDLNNKWLTKKITVKLVRQQNTIGNANVALNNGKVSINGHVSLSANVSINSSGATRDIGGNDTDINTVMENVARAQSAEILPLGNGTKSGASQHILELTQIKNAHLVNAKNPLLMQVNADLKADEMILPLSFDGEQVISVGFPQKTEKGIQTIAINKIPQVEENTRSVSGALKMAFLKIKLPNINANRLEWVEYSGGKLLKKGDNIAKKVASAKKVLLLIHGILGDTDEMAEAFGFAQSEKIYDLVLTYNYESLNTPIEKTAELLKGHLAAAGMSATKAKSLTIVAHSMGGLVSRYLIENLGGNSFVEKLITVGSPHNGSPFGTLTEYQRWALSMLNLRINLAKSIPHSVALVRAINKALLKSTKLTVSLEQMNPNSAFLKALAKNPDPNVKYFAIAGNVDLLKKDTRKGSFYERLQAKARMEVSEILSKEPNDMAVLVKSALALPKRTSQTLSKEVAAFHVNFFDSAAVLQEIENFMRKA